MRSSVRVLATVLTPGVLFVAQCSSSSGPAGEAELRVLHATPALGPVDVAVGGVTVIHAVPFGTTSSLVRVPAGQQHLVVRSGSQVLGELDPTLVLQHINSVVVANGTPQFSEVVVPDTGQALSNRANLRLVNVVGPNAQPPTLLDLLLKAPNSNPDSVARLGGIDTRIASYGTLMYFDPGHFILQYVPAGGSAVLAELSFDLAAGEKRAVVLQRAADGTYSAQLVVEP
jgi:hypothetical protein